MAELTDKIDNGIQTALGFVSNMKLIFEKCSEEDEPKNTEKKITVETIDFGVFEDRAVQGEYVFLGSAWTRETRPQ